MPFCSFCNLQYFRTPMGAVKVVNVIFGAASLILVALSYVPVWTLAVFTGTVSGCLLLSLLYMTFYLLASSRFVHSKANRITCFIYHVLAGTALIVAGIELVGWSEYDSKCTHDCPKLYTIGIAKTLTFMNGTLYMIVGFLGVKDDDMLDTETASEENLPLLASTTLLTSVPGSHNHLYDHHNGRVSFDDIRSNFYHNRSHHNEYSFNNSCSSSVHSGSNNQYVINGKRTRNLTMAFSMPAGYKDLQIIRE
ncbi:hypothetical protein Ocin01_13266 [Orchesella cincta]|uniref:Uncharacterized protein n=1 Tax=Orchesella cincta TaxID=48709 RepID=A0A1D2MKC6_ORCCI|nr:hypothetical protein Ocin01_13266 [Orchesella cincta]